ncbi:MAG: ABC transporter ATP-binding protein [Acidimicrobiia bacterium]
MTDLLEARNLCVGYGDLPVVADVDVSVRAGEVVALLGANGAGKTTTIRALAGVLPAKGMVRLDGAPLTGPLHRRARRGVALIPEGRSVFMGLSTEKNLQLGSGSVEAALTLFEELRPLLNRKAGMLSGGEQQILTLARALASRPRLLLADELSLGLAPKVVQRLLDAIRAAADEGAGVLVVEQHARKVLAIADRGYVMVRGRCELSGTGPELLARIDEVERAYLGGVPNAGDPPSTTE